MAELKAEVKNVKTFEGREGIGYSCTLYLDDRNAASVFCSADGTESRILWVNKEFEERFNAYVTALPNLLWGAFSQAMQEAFPEGMTHTPATAIELLVNQFLENTHKRIRG